MYLFILCSHSSGSTALWRLLQTSPHAAGLPVEGQHIEAVQAVMRQAPWNEGYQPPWPAVKAEWHKFWDGHKAILLEKSPPNLVRALAIEEAFEPACFVVMVRDPYAFCEGTKRRGRAGMGYRPGATYRQIAEGWARESRLQMKNIAELKRVSWLTYERLSDDPAGASQQLLHFLPQLERLDVASSFHIHSAQGWLSRPITNLNRQQIAHLSSADIAEINAGLKDHADVMAFFGYSHLEQAYPWPVRWRLGWSELFTKYVTRNWQRLSGS